MAGIKSETEIFEHDRIYSGFRLIEKRFVKEVNSNCLYFRHEKTGARLLKIAADDPNKLFNIAFKTLPENDFGTPHILEHSVLNGSKNFPVKSPFDILLKGSLNTFLNAMTSSDYTTYPVASMNMTDYFNLMHVYLDAVFNPLMLTDPRILKQEGWHLDLPDRNAPLTYKGVVYNEMKGAYSDPMTELYYQTGKNLFPDTTYGFESGGHPDAIPKLTQEYFTSFYRKFYHPSNSYILLYGDADPVSELSFIHEHYLSSFENREEPVDIPFQKPLPETKVIESSYAVAEGSPARDNTYLSLSFVTNANTDRTTTMALNMVATALVNHESAPLRLALQEAGIGREVTAWFSESKQNLFTILIQNANADDMDRFRKIFSSVLDEVISEGFDSGTIEGILNRTEFSLKEGDYPQKGLLYLFRNQQPWIYSGDPFIGLEFEKPLEEVKSGVRNRMLENLVQKYLKNNSHSLVLTLKPEPGLQAHRDHELEKELAEYKNSLTEAELSSLVDDTRSLLEFQQSEDTPEAIAMIPMLKLSDISPEPAFYPVEFAETAGVPLLHFGEFTNGIIYAGWYFDLMTLPKEKIPYASLLTSLLGKLNTENLTFGELDNQLNIQTGGFSVELQTFLENRNDIGMKPRLVVFSRATGEKAGKMTDLVMEILTKSRFGDVARLKTLLVRMHSNMEADIKQNGLQYARSRASSYISDSGKFAELTCGVDYFRFLTDLTKHFDIQQAEIISNLEETAALLFKRKNLVIQVTCSSEDLPLFRQESGRSLSLLPDTPVAFFPWEFNFSGKNEALLSASKVQYVVKGYNLKKLGYSWNGRMSVLNQIISTEWLQNRIRVIGGAYGGFSTFTPYGAAWFMSYRDPNLAETIDNFDLTPSFLEKFNADEAAMTRFIIGTIARLDQPRTASQKGRIAMMHHFEKTTADLLRRERSEILSTTANDIRNMHKMVADILAQDTWCVYGNEVKIKENRELFSELISVESQRL